MKNLAKDIAEVARYALHRIVAEKRLPTPLVYESEFIDAARKLRKERILKYLLEDEKKVEKQIEAVLAEAGGILSSLQLSITIFEEENKENIASIDRSVKSIETYSGGIQNDRIRKIVKEVIKLRETNQQLMENLSQTKKDLAEKEAAIQKLEQQSHTDPLTQLLNRRGWHKRLEMEFERSKRYQHPFSIIMIDIDHFKRFNDFYGHIVGDAILRKFSLLLKGTVRSVDTVFRYGGEEFTILLPETDLHNAVVVAKRILEKINNTVFTYKKKNLELKVTASIGVADSKNKDSPEKILELADQALYLSKHSGRNCIRTSEDVICDVG